MRFFSKEDDEFLLNNYCTIPAKAMSKMLGRSESSARQRMSLLNIVVPAEIIQKFKNDSRFKKGQIPTNKGKKQTEFMSVKGIEKSKATRFKKGVLPPNTKENFTISIRPDKRGAQYKFIRIDKGVWIPLHRYNWENKNGEIPAKMKLVFKDGDTMNCNVENLEILSSAQLMKKISYHNYPKPIAQLVQLRGALNRKINRKLKSLNNEN